MYSLYFRLLILLDLYFHYFILLVNVFFTSSHTWYIFFQLLHTPGTYTFHFFILLVNVYFHFFILYMYIFHYSISSSWCTYFPFLHPTVIWTREYVLSIGADQIVLGTVRQGGWAMISGQRHSKTKLNSTGAIRLKFHSDQMFS
jgi:hypothetical protein